MRYTHITGTITGVITGALLVLVAGGLLGCETAPRTDLERQSLAQDAQGAKDDFTRVDPTMETLFEDSHGYAIFLAVTQGAAGIGAAHGWGIVFKDGDPIGYAELTQGTLGAQLGGEEYRQVIFFEHESALRRFTQGQLAFAARASVTAAREGASADADFSDDVLVFTMRRGGAMFQAAIGGQNFSFLPKEEVE